LAKGHEVGDKESGGNTPRAFSKGAAAVGGGSLCFDHARALDEPRCRLASATRRDGVGASWSSDDTIIFTPVTYAPLWRIKGSEVHPTGSRM